MMVRSRMRGSQIVKPAWLRKCSVIRSRWLWNWTAAQKATAGYQ